LKRTDTLSDYEKPLTVDPEISQWCVAFLDLLGYSTVLKQMDLCPLPSDESGQAAFKKVFKRVVNLRTRLLQSTETFMRGYDTSASPSLAALPKKAQDLAKSVRRAEIFRTPGADHIVLGCSLKPNAAHFPSKGVFTVLLASAYTMLAQLAMASDDVLEGLPLRGAIDIGPGWRDPRDSYLYSTALANAYEMEHTKAKYPRVILSDRFVDFLSWCSASSGPGLEGQVTRALTNIMSGMLFQDSDGLMALDFLGEEVRRPLASDLARQLAGGAWKFATTARERFSRSGDERIGPKYEWLVEYLRPRLHFWGVSP